MHVLLEAKLLTQRNFSPSGPVFRMASDTTFMHSGDSYRVERNSLRFDKLKQGRRDLFFEPGNGVKEWSPKAYK